MPSRGVLAQVALCVLLSAAAFADGGELDGLIEPFEVVQVSSQVSGILDTLAVERGDRVEAGQVLARLKVGTERLGVELAEARLAFNERRAERNEELFKKQLVSTHEIDELKTEILISRLQLEDARERLAMRTVRSPIRGVVADRMLAAGEYVGTDPILVVAQVDPLNVEVIVPIARLGTLHKGMEAEVRPEAPIGGIYRGKVVIVDRVVDAASGTFGVRLEVENRDLRLPAGLKCKVKFLE